MKICYIITGLAFGGAEKLLLDLTNKLYHNHEIHIIYFKGIPKLKSKFSKEITFYQIQINLKCFYYIRKVIKKIAPDVVHTQLGHADLIGLWSICFLKVKRICTMQNIWFKWNYLDYIIFFLYRITFATVARDCKVICISKAVEEHVTKRLKVNPENAIMIYSAIPNLETSLDKNDLRKKLNIDEKDFIILFVGRLKIQKSIDTLLQTVSVLRKEISQLRVLIVGEGELEKQLKQLAFDLDVSSIVEFKGVTYSPEEYFAVADIFVLPSVFEGFGLVIVEAFRASLPAIAAAVEGPKELITDGKNGFLFLPKDYNALAECVRKLFYNPDLRQEMGQNAHNFFKNNFDIVPYSEKVERIYSL